MHKSLRLLLVVLAVGLLTVFIRQTWLADAPVEPNGASKVEAPKDSPKVDHSAVTEAVDTELQALEAELADATAAVRFAESQLGGLSLQSDPIEGRGDDPATHAQDVVPYMEPVLDQFLDRQAELDAALEREQTAKAALAKALTDRRQRQQ